jgi:hypothetical protein
VGKSNRSERVDEATQRASRRDDRVIGASIECENEVFNSLPLPPPALYRPLLSDLTKRQTKKRRKEARGRRETKLQIYNEKHR